MKESYGCEGISLHQYNEPAGNQDVWHYHLHVIPRWPNDDLYANYKNEKFIPKEERWKQADMLVKYLN